MSLCNLTLFIIRIEVFAKSTSNGTLTRICNKSICLTATRITTPPTKCICVVLMIMWWRQNVHLLLTTSFYKNTIWENSTTISSKDKVCHELGVTHNYFCSRLFSYFQYLVLPKQTHDIITSFSFFWNQESILCKYCVLFGAFPSFCLSLVTY